MNTVDRFGRRCIAWPLAVFGLILAWIGQGAILASAWILDIDIYDDTQSL